MRIAILAAMSKELELLRPMLEKATPLTLEGREAWQGFIGPHLVCLMQCGIGKVNSALNTSRMLRAFEPELVINSGVAGGADTSMRVADLLIAEEAAYHDVWCGPGTEYGAADGFTPRLACSPLIIHAAKRSLSGDDVHFGLICSGDKFISTPEEVSEIKGHFPDALACDMESAAIGQVCREAGVPFAILRVVSDTPGSGENISQYRNFWNEAPEKSFRAIKSLLSGLAEK